jgi:pimeloyl-ACP methyl ester carboxylesterase
VPTLYLHGAKDGCIGVELVKEMGAMFASGLQKVIIPDAGHFVHQEAAEDVNRHILRFLNG